MVIIKPNTSKAYYISNLLKKNLDIWKDVVHNQNNSVCILIDGRSGLGKTTLSFQLAKYLNPKFSLRDVAFTPQQFINILKKAKKGDICIFDEGMLLSSRSSMSALNRAIILMMAMIRSKNIFVIFNVNSIFDLDRNLPLHRADLLLHVYSEDGKLGSRGKYAVFPTAKGKLKLLYILGKKYYSYAKPKAVFVDHFSGYFTLNERRYEERKQKAINEFFMVRKPLTTKTKKQRDLLIRYIKRKLKISNLELSDLINSSTKTISRALNEDKPTKAKYKYRTVIREIKPKE